MGEHKAILGGILHLETWLMMTRMAILDFSLRMGKKELWYKYWFRN